MVRTRSQPPLLDCLCGFGGNDSSSSQEETRRSEERQQGTDSGGEEEEGDMEQKLADLSFKGGWTAKLLMIQMAK